MGQGLLRPLAQVCERDGGTGFEDDGGDDVLARLAGRHADCCDIENTRHRTYGVFHLRGVDVEAGGIDHLLAPVRHVDEAVAHLNEVARTQPSILGEDFGGLLVLVPIAGEHLRAAGNELTNLAVGHLAGGVFRIDDAHLGGGEGDAERPACSRGGEG